MRVGGAWGEFWRGRGVLVTKISHMMQEVSANWTAQRQTLVDRKGHQRPLLAQIPTNTPTDPTPCPTFSHLAGL